MHRHPAPKHPLQPRNWGQSSSDEERLAVVRPLLAGKSVLDVGGGTGRAHERLAQVSARIVGVDRDVELVERAVAAGYDMRHGDAQDFDLGERFDVVWAGELIEHLSNPGLFLDAVRRHLEPGGAVVLTTPNAFAVSNFVYRLGSAVRVNEEHTCWYCEDTLRVLLERHRFRVASVEYLAHQTPGKVRRLAARAVRAPLPPRLASNTILVVAHPAP